MNASSLATALLSRRVRLHAPGPEGPERTGQIVTVYFDGQQMRYVLLVAGQLVHADESQFTVMEDSEW